MRRYKLLKDVPMLHPTIFLFDDETGFVYWEDNGKVSEYPLRQGLGGYLWLLLTEKGYFRRLRN